MNILLCKGPEMNKVWPDELIIMSNLIHRRENFFFHAMDWQSDMPCFVSWLWNKWLMMKNKTTYFFPFSLCGAWRVSRYSSISTILSRTLIKKIVLGTVEGLVKFVDMGAYMLTVSDWLNSDTLPSISLKKYLPYLWSANNIKLYNLPRIQPLSVCQHPYHLDTVISQFYLKISWMLLKNPTERTIKAKEC